MKFSDFIGNERVREFFQQALRRQRLGHAFLFSGPAGLGKRTLAHLICRTLLCKQPAQDGPCENCVSCNKFDSGNHPDFHTYSPDGLYFKIDQVRRIIHDAAFKPVESRWKTFVLEGVDYMRDEGANAFLKVLEEPPGQTILFLLAESAEALLPTVRSRCQQFSFQPMPQAQIRAWLIEKCGHSAAEAAARASYSHGLLGRALTVNVEQYKEVRDRVLAAVEAALLPKNYFTLLDATKAVTVDRTEMPERFGILEELIRDLLCLKEGGTPIHEDVRSRLTAIAEKTSAATLQDFFDQLLQTREAVLKINANTGLSLQALLLPMRSSAE